MNEPASNTLGNLALIAGLVSLVLSVVSLMSSFAAGGLSLMCGLFGWLGAFVPLVTGILAFLALVGSIIVRVMTPAEELSSNRSFSLVGILTSLLSMALSALSIVISLWATILSFIAMAGYLLLVVGMAIVDALGL